MKITICLLFLIFSFESLAQASMRRCTLLPITDSVGGAIGFKVFEEIEAELKKSNWCTYVSNSGLISLFSKYRENLPQYLKTKEVLSTVANKLKVGSVIGVSIKSELTGVEVSINIYGENGDDIYFLEQTNLDDDNIDSISNLVLNWLEMYAKMIPYDAKINGILGDQITLDVGKGYPIREGQEFVVKRLSRVKKHPLLKKIVDWETEIIGTGKVFNISENQALGQVRTYSSDKKLVLGDWVRLSPVKEEDPNSSELKEEKEDESPGTLGILSMALFGSSSSADTDTPTGTKRMAGNLLGFDFRGEAWITRQYFAALEIEKSLGSLKKSSGNTQKSKVNANNSTFKLTGGYKYLPIGFFYGPQIDIYAGYVSHSFDLDLSAADGLGKNTISGLAFGTAVNVPLSREYRFFAQAEFIPFPNFKDEDNIYGSAKNVSALELEIGGKYQYTARMTLDFSIETLSRKAKFSGSYKEVSYKDNRLKAGVSFNF